MNSFSLFFQFLTLTVLDRIRRQTLVFANVVPGAVPSHPGVTQRRAESDLGNRHRLVTQGSAADQMDISGASDKPLGWIDDTAEAGERISMHLLGSCPETAVLTAAGAIAAGADVYTAAGGKVSALSGTPGTYYHIGTALTGAAADGDEIEVDTCIPRQVEVAG